LVDGQDVMFGLFRIALVALTGALIGASVTVPAALADDLSSLTPVGSSVLGAANVGSGLLNATGTSNTASSNGNTISVRNGGLVSNGAIGGNTITNNSGVTSVMMNSGNNVNFNNSMIVNVITPTH